MVNVEVEGDGDSEAGITTPQEPLCIKGSPG